MRNFANILDIDQKEFRIGNVPDSSTVRSKNSEKRATHQIPTEKLTPSSNIRNQRQKDPNLAMTENDARSHEAFDCMNGARWIGQRGERATKRSIDRLVRRTRVHVSTHERALAFV